MNDISLVIFTSEGREHLFYQTINSFYSACDYPFAKTILVIDGQVNTNVLTSVKADITVYHNVRQGYVKVISNTIKLIDTPYFFWLEDDFLFNQKVPITYMLNTMVKDKYWAGIFLSRTAPLSSGAKKQHLFDDFYVPDFGFSVSPTLCDTLHVRNAFSSIIAYPKNENSKYVSFEPFLDRFFLENNLKYAIIDPGSIAHVNHIGGLESTAREHHMINSLINPANSTKREYISGLQREKKINFYNKAAMFLKLNIAVFYLSIKLFFTREAYDFAFRIYVASLRRFKY